MVHRCTIFLLSVHPKSLVGLTLDFVTINICVVICESYLSSIIVIDGNKRTLCVRKGDMIGSRHRQYRQTIRVSRALEDLSYVQDSRLFQI